MTQASLEYHRQWRAKNPESVRKSVRKWQAKNHDKVLEIRRRFYHNNKSKVSAWRRNRKTQLKIAEGKHSGEDILRIFLCQEGICNGCQKPLQDYHVDHVIPISRNGSNWPINLQILCPACNLQKGNKTMDEWLSFRKVV